MKKSVIYFHSLSSPWAYLGWPRFQALIKKHDLNVIYICGPGHGGPGMVAEYRPFGYSEISRLASAGSRG